jgi:hypothetical protein
MRSVDLVALHETHVLQAGRRRLDGLQRIDEHLLVWRDELSPGRAVLIGGIEDVRDVGEIGELAVRVLGVEQVDAQVTYPAARLAAAA